MVNKKSVKTIVKIISALSLVLFLIASYSGYNYLIQEFNIFISSNNIDSQQLNNFYSKLKLYSVVFLLSVLIINSLLSTWNRGKFNFYSWMKWNIISLISLFAAPGLVLYRIKQTGFYKILIFPIIPFLLIFLLALICIQAYISKEQFKLLFSKAGRRNLIYEIKKTI